MGKDKRSDVFSVSLLYTLLTIFGLWFLEDVMVLQEWEDVDWMMTEVVMLSGFPAWYFLGVHTKAGGAGHKSSGSGYYGNSISGGSGSPDI